MITPDLRCYGEVAAALGGLVPELDLRSTADTLRWYARAWENNQVTDATVRSLIIAGSAAFMATVAATMAALATPLVA